MNNLLKNFIKYIIKVYQITNKINSLKDTRTKAQISMQVIFITVFMGLCFGMDSLNQIKGWVKRKKFINLFPKKLKLPGVDTIRRMLCACGLDALIEINNDIIHKAERNHIFRKGSIKGWRVVAMDGVELFESTVKSCESCLTRECKDGLTHYFHRAVICMTVGSKPYLILGMDMLKPRDGLDKDEGEQTGAKRLIHRLYNDLNHFADIIVFDALYCNQPSIQAVLDCKMDAVVRLKDERLNILKDARVLLKLEKISATWSVKNKKQSTTTTIRAKEGEFIFGTLKENVRVYCFEEHIVSNSCSSEPAVNKEVWVLTTLNISNNAQAIWEIMHKRWDIENSGIHELKGKWNLNHCFIHHPNAIATLFQMMIIAFNLLQLYLFSRIRNFAKYEMSQKMVLEELLHQSFDSAYKGIPFLWAPPPS